MGTEWILISEFCERTQIEADFVNALGEEGIIEFAEHEKIDLLVMATHARKGLAHMFNGSVTEKIVNRLDYPVWTYALEDH